MEYSSLSAILGLTNFSPDQPFPGDTPPSASASAFSQPFANAAWPAEPQQSQPNVSPQALLGGYDNSYGASLQQQQQQQQQQHSHSHSHYQHQHQQHQHQQPHLEPDPYDPYDMADMVHIRGRPYTLRLNTDLSSAPSSSGTGAGASLGGWLHDNIDDDFSVSTPASSVPGAGGLGGVGVGMGAGMDVDHGLDHDHPQPQSCPPSMMTVPSQVAMAMPRVGKGVGLGQVQGLGHGHGQSQPISFYSPR